MTSREAGEHFNHESAAAPRYDCPMCGQPVSIHSSDEGTSSYVGDAENALRILLGWQPHLESALAHLHPQHREAIAQARRVIGDDIPF